MNDENQVMETPTGDAAGLSVTMDRMVYKAKQQINIRMSTRQTINCLIVITEDWESVCELAGVDPDNEDQEIKLYVCAIEVKEND